MPLLMCDLDDTLVVRPPLFRAWAESFLASYERPDLVDWVVAQDRNGHRPRHEFFTAVADAVGFAGDPDDLLQDFYESFSASYRLTDDVRDALVDARERGWRIAVVTNGLTAGQLRKVDASGLDHLVDAVCVSEEVGAWKPDPRIFREAAARAGATLDDAWMVGDNLDADVAGAAAVGARTVWVKREYDPLTYASDVEPDHVVGSGADGVRLATRPAPASG